MKLWFARKASAEKPVYRAAQSVEFRFDSRPMRLAERQAELRVEQLLHSQSVRKPRQS